MEGHSADPLNGRKISDILTALSQHFSSQTVTIGELRDALSGRIYGVFLLVLALPNLVPFPVPGLSAITGLPLLLLTIQMIFNRTTPWFPKAVLNRTIKTDHLHKVCSGAFPYLHKMERFVMPRFMWLVRYPADRVIAAICVFLSLVIMLPIPFGNALPALAICFFSIAILQRDGLFVILGVLCAIASVAVIASVLTTILMAVLHFWGLG
ncbi:MAG: exopolysaccharide biosynthesis protein [Alphaproteobacteria bacterium]